MSRQKCSICARPDALAISSALEAGVKQLSVAAQFHVSKFALSRHKNRCLTPLAATAGESTGDQLEMWLRRADELYLVAGVNGDVRSQVAALSAAVRSLQSEQKREEKRQEVQREIPINGCEMTEREGELIRNWLDRLMRNYRETAKGTNDQGAMETILQ